MGLADLDETLIELTQVDLYGAEKRVEELTAVMEQAADLYDNASSALNSVVAAMDNAAKLLRGVL